MRALNFMRAMSYICRDCGHIVETGKPVNRCPECESIYLLPKGYKPGKLSRKSSIIVSERFLSLFFGFFGGLLTFFIWGVFALFYGGAGAAKISIALFYIGIKISFVVAVVLSIVGFIVGQDKLVKIFSIMWGTDKDFNNRADKLVMTVPDWFWVVVLGVIIVGSFGYLGYVL